MKKSSKEKFLETPRAIKPMQSMGVLADNRRLAMVAHRTYLAYLMADVCYSVLHYLCQDMNGMGKDLKYDSKRRFNEFFESIQKSKRLASRATDDTFKVMPDGALEAYQDYANFFLEIISEIYDRSMLGGKVPDRMLAAIRRFKGLSEDEIYKQWCERASARKEEK